MNKVILTLTLLMGAFAPGLLHAQFVQERSIENNERSIQQQQMELTVFDADSRESMTADVNIYGLNPRKGVTMKAVEDTTFEIRNYRLYTVSCVKQGYMYYSEKFWPEEVKIHKQDVALRPLAVGQKTDVRDITFLGDKTEIYHKSKPALEELVEFMKINPTIKIVVIGHVNGPDNKRSQRFYVKASESRAAAVRDYLIGRGIEESRVTTKGAGNTEMIYPDPVTDWQNEANRRIEIELTAI